MLHEWGSNAELMLPIAAPLRRAGLTVLLCDARNHGPSDSDTFSSLPRFAEDLGQAIAWLKRHYPGRAERIAVLGHSVGAGAALFEAARNPDIAAVISPGAFAHPAEVTRRTLRRLCLPRFVTLLVIRYVKRVIGHRFDRHRAHQHRVPDHLSGPAGERPRGPDRSRGGRAPHRGPVPRPQRAPSGDRARGSRLDRPDRAARLGAPAVSR